MPREVSAPFYCNKFTNNSSLICFYILFCIYFIIQAWQIQKGQPELRKGSFMMESFDPVSKTVFSAWYYIPFLFELRSIIDWTFTYTALDVF